MSCAECKFKVPVSFPVTPTQSPIASVVNEYSLNILEIALYIVVIGVILAIIAYGIYLIYSYCHTQKPQVKTPKKEQIPINRVPIKPVSHNSALSASINDKEKIVPNTMPSFVKEPSILE